MGIILPEAFRGPFLKLHRAETHVIELHTLLKRFMKLQSYKAVADFKKKPGYIAWVARGKDGFPHDEFSPIVGDIIHNLRQALDISVCTIVRLAKKRDDRIYFPALESLEHLRCSMVKGAKNECFPPKLKDLLETRIQPYKGGAGHHLWGLNKIVNGDKHREIVPTIFAAGIIHIEDGGIKIPIQLLGRPKPIKDRCVLAFEKIGPTTNIKVNQKAKLTLEIQFGRDCYSIRGFEVEEGCRQLMYATESAVEAIAETCL